MSGGRSEGESEDEGEGEGEGEGDLRVRVRVWGDLPLEATSQKSARIWVHRRAPLTTRTRTMASHGGARIQDEVGSDWWARGASEGERRLQLPQCKFWVGDLEPQHGYQSQLSYTSSGRSLYRPRR